MKRLLTLAAFALLSATCAFGQGQGSGILYASDFNAWSLPQGAAPAAGMIQWPSAAICQVSSNGYSFTALKVGRPITIVDVVPTQSETVIPTAVTTSGGSCTVTAPMANMHVSYHVESGTFGLQEAIDYAASRQSGAVVVATPQWAYDGGVTSTITGASGSAAISILDERVATLCAYAWTGSAYAQSGCSTQGDAITGVTAGSGLTGGGTSGDVVVAVDPTVIPFLDTDDTFTGAITVNGSVTGHSTFNGTNFFAANTSTLTSATETNGISYIGDGTDLSFWFGNLNAHANYFGGITGAFTTNSSSTSYEADAVQGTAIFNGGSPNTVGGRFNGICQLPGNCWGMNSLAQDMLTTGAGSTLWGYEDDVNVSNATTRGFGLQIIGAWSAQPSSFPAVNVARPLQPNGANFGWTHGLFVEAGAVEPLFPPDNTVAIAPGVFLNPVVGTSSQNSQGIVLDAEGPGGVITEANIFNDLNGNLNLCTSGSWNGCAGVTHAGVLDGPFGIAAGFGVNWLSQPVNMPAFEIQVPPQTGSNNYGWTSGFQVDTGSLATTVPAGRSNAVATGVLLNPVLGAVGQTSQALTFISEDSLASLLESHIFNDELGDLLLCTNNLWVGCPLVDLAQVLHTPALIISGQATGVGTNCLQIDTSGTVTSTGSACGSGGGGGVTAIDTQTGAFTFGGAGVSHVGNAYTFSGTGSGVSSINTVSGAFTFTGAGVSCSTTTCTFSGTGSGVTSVALTTPSWLTVAGSPITSSGTLAVTATGAQTAKQFLATPNATTGAVGLRTIVASDIPTLNQNTTGTAAGLTSNPSVSVTNLTILGTCTGCPGAGGGAFNSITSGTNTAAAMLVGTGASLGTTGSGTIQATSLTGNIPESQVTNLTTDLAAKVATTTTVNGHALSANVTVSASDITTGTLPAAQLPAQYKIKPCSVGMGDGVNPIPAGTYPLKYQCFNDYGVTYTITGFQCASALGSPTANAADNSGNALLTGAITANSTWAPGTQSATTTLANGAWVNWTIVADGVSTQIQCRMKGTY